MRWWKILCIILLFYTFIAGFLIKVPDIGNLEQTIRNAFFHIPMWMCQFVLVSVSLVYSILYLRKPTMSLVYWMRRTQIRWSARLNFGLGTKKRRPVRQSD